MELWNYFVQLIDKYFKYLESDFKFKKVSAKIPFVVFESPFLRINIFYECGGRYELDLGIEPFKKIGDGKVRYSWGIGQLIELHNPEKIYMAVYPYTKEELEVAVQELAELFLKYGSDILHGDLRDLEELEKLDKQAAMKYSKRRHS